MDSMKLLNTLHLKECDGKPGIYFTKHALQLNGMWDMLVAGTNGNLPTTTELYFNSKIPGIYINVLDLTGIRVRASLNEDCLAPWTSGAERMRLDNFFGEPRVGISSKPGPTTRRVILQRYSKHPRGLPISKKILSIPDAEKPHMFAEGTNALVVYFVKSPFEVQPKESYRRISADSKQLLIDLIEKNPMLSTEKIHELMARELDGQNVPDLKRIQFQQKKFVKSLFVEKKPKRMAGSRVIQSNLDKDLNETEPFQYKNLLESLGLNEEMNEEAFGDFGDLDEPGSSSLSHSPLNALLMQTSSLTNRIPQSPQTGIEYESFEEKVPSYYMDLARGVSVKEALSTHRKVPETGQLFTGAQKLVLDGIVKTLNELLLKSANGSNDGETPLNVLHLFPDVKPSSGNDF